MTDVPGPSGLSMLAPGTTVRVMTSSGPGIGIRNGDGTWSVAGIVGTLTSAQLWAHSQQITVHGVPRASEYPLGA